MTEPAWRYYEHNPDVVIRTWDDGRIESCYVTVPEVQAWIAAGNVIHLPD